MNIIKIPIKIYLRGGLIMRYATFITKPKSERRYIEQRLFKAMDSMKDHKVFNDVSGESMDCIGLVFFKYGIGALLSTGFYTRRIIRINPHGAHLECWGYARFDKMLEYDDSSNIKQSLKSYNERCSEHEHALAYVLF